MLIPKPRASVAPQDVVLEKLILTEGDTPAHFFDALVKYMACEHLIEIRNYGGITQLASFLRTLASTTAFQERVKSVGIIRDAEEDPFASRRSVDDAIEFAKIPAGVSVKVAILPDNSTPGMIETLCLRSVETNPVFECISQFMACAEEKGVVFPKGPIRAKHVAEVNGAHLAPNSFPHLDLDVS